MQLDPVLVLPDTDLPRGLVSRRSLLALFGAGAAVTAGGALGVLLTPATPSIGHRVSAPTLEEAELRWARSLAEGPLDALAAARSPYLFVLARTGDPRLLGGAERLGAMSADSGRDVAAAQEQQALNRQLLESLRVSGLVERAPRAAALVERLGGVR